MVALYPPKPVVDLRQQLEFNNNYVAMEMDLRRRLDNKSTSYSDVDLRARLNARTHAEAFREGAAGAAPPLAAFLPPEGSSSFSRRIRARNLSGPHAVKAETLAQHPVLQEDKKKVNANLTNAERTWNPFMLQPLFHRRCQACSSQHCSRFCVDGTTPNCHKFRDHLASSATRRICDYKRCPNPYDHFTPVCPALHQRCPRCGCRGHGERDNCDISNVFIMSSLREDFEDQANVGYYTQHRFTRLAWGFYAYPPDGPRADDEPLVDYAVLSDKPVLQALHLLYDVLEAPGGRVDPPTEMAVPSSFERAGNAGIAPNFTRRREEAVPKRWQHPTTGDSGITEAAGDTSQPQAGNDNNPPPPTAMETSDNDATT